MILADINFKWKFDYEMCQDEQTFHEHYVDAFKFKFDRWLQSCGVNSNYRVIFDFYYFPLQRKFYLYKVSRSEDLIHHALKTDSRFYKEYFTATIQD